MSTASKQLEVQIMGQSYLLGCPDGGQARLLDAVERVDSAMCKIRDGGKIKARDRIAVLAALNLAFELSEREAAASSAAAAGAKVTPPAAPVPSGAHQAANDTRLDALLMRMDMAIAGDGQLL
jgi:cell division protein ZapA